MVENLRKVININGQLIVDVNIMEGNLLSAKFEKAAASSALVMLPLPSQSNLLKTVSIRVVISSERVRNIRQKRRANFRSLKLNC